MDQETFMAMLNDAADDVLDEVDAPDTGTRDIVNLIVNLMGARMKNPDATIAEAIIEQYSREMNDDETREETDEEMVSRVLGWCET
jgi:hypothetical protein